MVYRIFSEKKKDFCGEATALREELENFFGIKGIEKLRIINRYDVDGIDAKLFKKCIPLVFSEPQVDKVSKEIDAPTNATVFAVEFLPGQFDQRADSASECILLISQKKRPIVRYAKIYVLQGDLSTNEIETIKRHVINPVEAREASLDKPQTLEIGYEAPKTVEVLNSFLDLSEDELDDFIEERGLAMDLSDIRFCQKYFADEGRCPTITEIKIIDTYWSDHCRHTTFGTILDDVQIEDEKVEAAYREYLKMRTELGLEKKEICLMDMGTIGSKWLRMQGFCTEIDESEEVNACTIKIKCDRDGHEEDWLYLFKNETHNHPTEIEPFGGAATCIGGAIRDPLSGRSYVYQAMRLTGAADPKIDVEDTIPGKLPQRNLVTKAAEGYSSYGNQIGLATGCVHELYHPGYAAKRMEIGAVVAAGPAENVKREHPTPGDVILLLGGKTGRDGIGGATGSSKGHKKSSLETCGAEVQKGNAPMERKLQRLFRRKDACELIKRCNDFGAGGVSVAVGELADGLRINLNAVPKKYEGLDGTEIALSESQERMAVALDADDIEKFKEIAMEENLEAVEIAEVTDNNRVVMNWNGDNIVDVGREFLASNGAPKHQDVRVLKMKEIENQLSSASLEEKLKILVSDLNTCSNKGLSERFDSTIGAATVLMPFGGKTQLCPTQTMVAKLPVDGDTSTCSGMAWGFNPKLSEADQYSAAYLAVVESVAKLIASGFSQKDIYLTLQEYFERLGTEPTRWAKPMAAVLGALMAQKDFHVGAIGGKDSMSGSFEDINV
ncbi:MAG: phosphoribosylformylglycinamidine synthase, partial [Eggerthellaceae bacterium]|nr:phosphoribosylformylglycinamidine synthase [Eggerthellaceae bacterium]